MTVGPDSPAGPTPAVPPDEPNYTRSTFAGLKWTYLSTAVSLLMTLAYSVTINRLLGPEIFGLVASTQVVLRFGSYAAELGLGPALVQRENLTDNDIRTAFTSSVLLGVALATALALAAPFMEAIFGSPDVVPVMRAMAFTLLLTGLQLTALNLLRRRMQFRTIATIEVVSYAVGYLVVGLSLAAAGAGVWSLVGAILTEMTVRGTWTVLAARHPLRPRLAGAEFKRLYSFGGKVSVISMLEYAGQALNVVLIGRRAGQAALGQYNRGNLLIDLPLVNLTFGLSDVLFPTLSRLQNEPVRIAKAYIGAISTVGAFVLPLGAGIAVAAPQLVLVVLGDQWDTAAVLLPALTGAAVMNVLTTFGGIVAEALDQLTTKLVLQATYVVVLGTGLMLVPADLLVGYVVVYFAAEVLRHAAYVVFMGRLLSLPPRVQASAYLRPLAAAAAVGAGVWAVTQGALAAGLPVAAVFACQAVVGAVVLLVMAAIGPLWPVRRDLRDRIAGAYDDEGRGATLAVRVLSLGDRVVGGRQG